ncbi:hypothetical protein AAMO2058_000867700 [Amorphochlora amoebiformis]
MSASYTIQTFAPLGIIFGSICGIGYGIKGVQTLFGYHQERKEIILYRLNNNCSGLGLIPPKYSKIYFERMQKAAKEAADKGKKH